MPMRESLRSFLCSCEPNPKRRRLAMTDRWPRARTKGQMAQTRNKHHNLQQAIYLRARTFHLCAIDARYFGAVPPWPPVRFVDHHEAKTSSLSVSFGLDIWAGGFVPPAFFYRIMKNCDEPQPSLLVCRTDPVLAGQRHCRRWLGLIDGNFAPRALGGPVWAFASRPHFFMIADNLMGVPSLPRRSAD
jgi:hypothetical protein